MIKTDSVIFMCLSDTMSHCHRDFSPIATKITIFNWSKLQPHWWQIPILIRLHGAHLRFQNLPHC